MVHKCHSGNIEKESAVVILGNSPIELWVERNEE